MADDDLAHLILRYLSAHPRAKDTATGIARWWLNAEAVSEEAVLDALDRLTEAGWLIPRGGGPQGPLYQLNPERAHELGP